MNGSVASEIIKDAPCPHINRNPFVTASSCGKPSSAEKPILRGIIGIVQMDRRTMFMKMRLLTPLLKVKDASIMMIRLHAISVLTVTRYLLYLASNTPTNNEAITPHKVIVKPIALISEEEKPSGLKNSSMFVPKEVKTPCIKLYMITSFI